MIQNLNSPKASVPNDDEIDLKELAMRALYLWKWFVLSLLIGLSGAWLYNHYSPPQFETNATVLVEDEKKMGIDSEGTEKVPRTELLT